MFFFASLKIQTFSFTYPDTLFGTVSRRCQGRCGTVAFSWYFKKKGAFERKLLNLTNFFLEIIKIIIICRQSGPGKVCPLILIRDKWGRMQSN